MNTNPCLSETGVDPRRRSKRDEAKPEKLAPAGFFRSTLQQRPVPPWLIWEDQKAHQRSTALAQMCTAAAPCQVTSPVR